MFSNEITSHKVEIFLNERKSDDDPIKITSVETKKIKSGFFDLIKENKEELTFEKSSFIDKYIKLNIRAKSALIKNYLKNKTINKYVSFVAKMDNIIEIGEQPFSKGLRVYKEQVYCNVHIEICNERSSKGFLEPSYEELDQFGYVHDHNDLEDGYAEWDLTLFLSEENFETLSRDISENKFHENAGISLKFTNESMKRLWISDYGSQHSYLSNRGLEILNNSDQLPDQFWEDNAFLEGQNIFFSVDLSDIYWMSNKISKWSEK